MITKLIASLNWVLGTIALLGALLAPIVLESVSSKDLVVKNVALIKKAQSNLIEQNKDYVIFGRDEMVSGFTQLKLDMFTDDFAYEAFREPNGDLVIRGMTTKNGVLDSKIPPFIYRYTIPADGSGDMRAFVDLSGKRRGLAVFDLFSF